MAHAAKVNPITKIVEQVLVIPDSEENRIQEYLSIDCNLPGKWIQTSYNTVGGKHLQGKTPIYKNFAGKGFIFDGTGFYAPQPYDSWILDQETYIWNAPIPYPSGHGMYQWNEELKNWVEIPTN